MKICPNCHSTFTDNSLNFCLQDGSRLTELGVENLSQGRETAFGKEAPTIRMNSADMLEMKQEETLDKKDSIAPPKTRGTGPALTIGVIVIALCLICLVGIGFVFLAKDKLFVNKNTYGTNKNTNISNANISINTNASNQIKTVTVTASSTREPYKDITYSPSFVIDGDPATAWIEGASGEGVGQWIRCDFGRTVTLKQIIVYPGYFKNESVWTKNNRLAQATFYFSNGVSRNFTFTDKMEPRTVDVGKVKTSYVKLLIEDFYSGTTDSEDTAISELSFVFE